MKKFFNFSLAVLVVMVTAGIVLGLGSWLVSILLNVALVQMGLGTVNAWGVCNLTIGIALMCKYIKWIIS